MRYFEFNDNRLIFQKENLSPEEYQQRRDQLLNKQQLELSDLDRQLAEEQKEIERGALRDWEVRRARAKLDLKEKHYKVRLIVSVHYYPSIWLYLIQCSKESKLTVSC